MVNIALDKDYKITSDSMNYILEKRSSEPNEKTGEYSWRQIKWSSDLSNMLRIWKELKIRTSDSTTIDEILELVKKTDKEINKILKGV